MILKSRFRFLVILSPLISAILYNEYSWPIVATILGNYGSLLFYAARHSQSVYIRRRTPLP